MSKVMTTFIIFQRTSAYRGIRTLANHYPIDNDQYSGLSKSLSL